MAAVAAEGGVTRDVVARQVVVRVHLVLPVSFYIFIYSNSVVATVLFTLSQGKVGRYAMPLSV